MKAIVKKSATDTTFSIINRVIPDIHTNEYLVSICAIGVGIHDGYFLPEQMTFTYKIGIEAAGIIEDKGTWADEFLVGDRIAFFSTMHPEGGT